MKVSAFKSIFENTPQVISLENWLNGNSHYNNMVMDVRSENDINRRKALKMKLPVITPAGVFKKPNDESLINFSGLMCIDFDNMPDPLEAKLQIMNNRSVWYTGLSTSGNGLFSLVVVSKDAFKRWKEYFNLIAGIFGANSIYVDKHCSNISRRRFYSYDPDGVFNHNALNEPLVIQPAEAKKIITPVRKLKDTSHYTPDEKKIEYLLRLLEQKKVDITFRYADWISIGCVFVNIFGENGREYFHRISQFYPGYDAASTDKQFNKNLKNQQSFGIGMLLNIAKKYNIYLKNHDGSG